MSRILARLDELYAIGQHRAGYSPEEDAAHELASRWLREAGLEVTSDDAGNLFGRRGEARVWSGSHLDSVPTAGRFDGALGVVAAIEAAERLPEAPLAVVAFRAEETGPMGSKRLTELPDAFLEVHIEQGPVLAQLDEPLGVVTAIAGQARGFKVFEGRADHAGTTPMDARADALLEAARFILHVRDVRARRDGRDRRRDRGRAERDQRRPGEGDGLGRRALRRRRAARRADRRDRLRAQLALRPGADGRRLRGRCCPTRRGSSRARGTTRWCSPPPACPPRCSSCAR